MREKIIKSIEDLLAVNQKLLQVASKLSPAVKLQYIAQAEENVALIEKSINILKSIP